MITRPGDIVAWDLGGGQTHIGMVVDRQPLLARRYMVLHNIGRGPQIEDVLFDWKIIGHYRYFGPKLLPNTTASRHSHAHSLKSSILCFLCASAVKSAFSPSPATR